MADEHCLAAAEQGQDYFLGVYCRREVVIAYDVKAGAKGVLDPTTIPARVTFPDGENPEKYVEMVIECSFSPETKTWHFMRERSKCEAWSLSGLDHVISIRTTITIDLIS
jgi:hypothetical protein